MSHRNEQITPATILIVGDTTQRRRLEAAVGVGGRTVDGVDEISDAMGKIAEGGYDLVLLDLAILPGDVALTVVDASLMDSPATGVIVIVDPETPEHVQGALARGAAFALTRPGEDSVIQRVVELVLRGQAGVSTGRVRQAVEAINGAESGRKIRGRVLQWAMTLTEAKGASLYRVDERGQPKVFAFSREHTEQLEKVAAKVLSSHRPMELLGTLEERAQLQLPDDALHGPALFWPIEGLREPTSLITVVREVGAAPFTPAERDKLAMVAAAATLAFDRLAGTEMLQARADEIERLQNRLSGAERSQGVGEMATGYAHQMQNPLQFLHAQLREARDAAEELEEGSEALDEALAGIRDGVDRLQGIVGELSLLGRAKNDAMVPVDRLMAIARRITNMRQDISIVEELESISVIGHLTGIAHALHKLLDNAILAAHDKVTVRAFQKQDEEIVTIIIGDDGGGMPKNVVTRIFEPFFTTRKDATGTGLSDALDIILAAGGTLEIETKLGFGTKAIVNLPMATAANVLPMPEKFTDDKAV